ncbi:fibrillarin-like rRNA/tRNA 2'-O-methyltransferase [Candidatus Woesearchaeota archaeon]|nr:fibrillarin-like rRNA/tRNA 2'-O-methyltransferase [Candidatus Woesearchaeota archaeon]
MGVRKSKIFEVYESDDFRKRKLYTANLVPGKKAYGENIAVQDGIEYREWDAGSSKLASLILNGCTNTGIRNGDVVLYLGSSTGTTVSHVSDIVGKEGFVFALDVAPRVMRDLVFMCEDRKNIAPILADANKPDSFKDRVMEADVLYQDIAQKNQVEIFLKNVKAFLKKGGYALLAVKARNIDVTRNPKDIFRQVRAELESHLTIIDFRTLDPYQRDHCMFVCKRQ